MRIALLVSLCLTLTLPVWGHFPEDYPSSREYFFKLAKHFIKSGWGEQFSLPIPSQKAQDLSIDALYLPASEKTKNLMIITSGIHGVEAATGAALQFEFLKHLAKDAEVLQEWRPDTGFLIVHAVNPFGFRFNRRVDEQNVDLNRNLGGEDALFSTQRESYKNFYDFLNPQKPVSASWGANMQLFLESLWKLITLGRKQLTEIAIGGQYQSPMGIYFGGRKVQTNGHRLRKLFRRVGEKYDRILHIDLHTGYGKRGVLHLFGDRQLEKLPGYRDLFKGLKVDLGSDEDFYEVTGSFAEFTLKAFQDKAIVIPMTFEFGTMNSQTILGGFRSLRNMIQENQGHFHGYATPEDEVLVKRRFMEMFYPSDPDWRAQVMASGQKHLILMVKRLRNLQ